MSAFVFRGSTSSALLGFGSPGLLELGMGPSLLGTADIDTDFIPQDFEVSRAVEGPQLIISWSNPASADAYPYDYQLRRGAHHYPLRITDGDLVSTGTADGDVVLSDRSDLVAGEVYHYTLFVKDPTQSDSPEDDPPWFTHAKLQRSAEAFETGYWKTRLFQLLPAIYQAMDKRPDLGGLFGQEVLELQTASSGLHEGQVFNFAESQVLTQGQLERFVKLLSLPLDELRRLIDRHRQNLHPHTVLPGLLRYLAGNIGWDLNEEIPLRNQRLEVANASHFWRNKGLEEGIETQAEASGGVRSVTIREGRNNVLLTTRNAKAFGQHWTGRDLVGTPSRDFTLESEDNAPSAFDLRPHGLMFDAGLANLPPGQIVFPLTGDTPRTRPKMFYPGAFTVELWIRVRRWPTLESTEEEAPAADLQIETGVFSFIHFFGDRTLVGLRLRTIRHAETGFESHALAIVSGDIGAEEDVAVLSDVENEIELDQGFHIAVTRSILGSQEGVPSPEPDNTRWSIYLDGTLVTEVERPSGYRFDPRYSVGDDEIILGGDTTNQELVVVDELRCWSVSRTAAEIAAHYRGVVNGDAPNLTLLAPMNDPHLDPVSDGTEAVVDLSSVDSGGFYETPVLSPTATVTAPVRVGPVAPDPFVELSHYDEHVRRRTGVAAREGFVVSSSKHLRSTTLVARPGRRVNYADA